MRSRRPPCSWWPSASVEGGGGAVLGGESVAHAHGDDAVLRGEGYGDALRTQGVAHDERAAVHGDDHGRSRSGPDRRPDEHADPVDVRGLQSHVRMR